MSDFNREIDKRTGLDFDSYAEFFQPTIGINLRETRGGNHFRHTADDADIEMKSNTATFEKFSNDIVGVNDRKSRADIATSRANGACKRQDI